MHPDSIPLTAFVTPFGHYEYLRMAMGLRNAPASFGKGMANMTDDLENILVYLDDCNVYTKDPSPGLTNIDVLWQDHYSRINTFLLRCRQSNLKLNGAKCMIGEDELPFLGHICSHKGLRPDPSKILAVKSMKNPSCVAEIRTFLGLVGYYRSFIPQMADRIINLNRLLRKGTDFIWSEECSSEFNDMKNCLCDLSLRIFPDMTRPFELHTDASDYALGSVLVQKDLDGTDMPIEFYSRSFTPAELNYTVYEKECLAVVTSVKKFNTYLAGRHFEIFTDHRAIESLLTIKEHTRRIARWTMTLAEYDFTATYRKGSHNLDADALSRLFSSTVRKDPETHIPGQVISKNGQLLSECQFELDIPSFPSIVTKGFTVSSIDTDTDSPLIDEEDDIESLRGKHFLDPVNPNLEFVVTDVWYDDIHKLFVGTRREVVKDSNVMTNTRIL